MATPEEIETAFNEFKASVVARQEAQAEYDQVLTPFQEKRKNLILAHKREDAADKALEALQAAYTAPDVPAVPADE